MNKKILIGLAALLVIAGGAYWGFVRKASAPVDDTGGGSGIPASIPDLITVDSPTKGEQISSPVTITGFARGTWYFEASFPIEIADATGKIIGQGHAEAQSDWMTENFVPFTAVVTFYEQPEGSTGTIIVHKDNPSGDAARDRALQIPITF